MGITFGEQGNIGNVFREQGNIAKIIVGNIANYFRGTREHWVLLSGNKGTWTPPGRPSIVIFTVEGCPRPLVELFLKKVKADIRPGVPYSNIDTYLRYHHLC